MSSVYRIKKGLNIKLKGEAEKTVTEIKPTSFAVKPTDFIGVFPKMLVKEGDEVKAGTPLFFDKYREEIIFTSPVSGKISEIKRGLKRVLEEIKIDADPEVSFVDFGSADPESLSREEIIEKLRKSGVWPVIRQRPYSTIAHTGDNPKAIHITCFNTAPLAPDYDFLVHNNGDIFQAGLNVLLKLTSGKVHVNIDEKNTTSEVFTNARNVQINHFSGPHPSGNISVQINRIDPINKGDIVWYLDPLSVLTIGRLFLEGHYNTQRLIAICGSEIKRPKYFKTYSGNSITELIADNISDNKLRFISGNVLTGKKILSDGYMGFYDNLFTVIPEGDHYDFIGWALPGLKKFSLSRMFCSWMMPHKKWDVHTNLNGGERAFVITGEMEKVFPLDIYPMQLIKSIMVEDIDLMENLGIYEVDEEDFALCEFVNTSKVNIQEIVRNGLNLMRKEMS